MTHKFRFQTIIHKYSVNQTLIEKSVDFSGLKIVKIDLIKIECSRKLYEITNKGMI